MRLSILIPHPIMVITERVNIKADGKVHLSATYAYVIQTLNGLNMLTYRTFIIAILDKADDILLILPDHFTGCLIPQPRSVIICLPALTLSHLLLSVLKVLVMFQRSFTACDLLSDTWKN